MDQELLEKTAASRLTRRTIVTTGTKLAYAAPVVAASMKLGTRLGYAASGTGGENEGCGHSQGTNGGCMPVCHGVVGVSTLDAQDPCAQICDALCKQLQGNICTTDAACVASNFVVTNGGCTVTFTDPVSGSQIVGQKTVGNCA